MRINSRIVYILILSLTACTAGPDYKRPEINIPTKFKEAGIEWKIINPGDDKDIGNWWKIFKDPALDELEHQLDKNNHNIKVAESSYKKALALVDKARTGYLPTINASGAITKEKPLSGNDPSAGKVKSTHSVSLSGSWEPDVWGNVAREVESSLASAEGEKANLASVRLASQASLAGYYFELRTLDRSQEILDKIVTLYEANLEYVKNRRLVGVMEEKDVVEADQQLQAARATASNNKINRAQYQHAIAVLIGESPSNFAITTSPQIVYPDISIPIGMPSTVLERRPDIAYAERQVAVANAQIGIAEIAFFPNFTIPGSVTYQGDGLKKLFSLPTLIWSVGPQLAFNLTNLAAYKVTTVAAQENYYASVESYKQTVLAAFQDIEDNMVAIRVLEKQIKIQKLAVHDAKQSLDIITNQHKVGIIDQSQILLARIAYYNAKKNLNDTEGLRIDTSIGLIKALGGGW